MLKSDLLVVLKRVLDETKVSDCREVRLAGIVLNVLIFALRAGVVVELAEAAQAFGNGLMERLQKIADRAKESKEKE